MPVLSPNLMTSTQAAEALGVSRTRVLALIRAGRLPAEKVGRDWLLRPEDVENFARRPQGNFRLTTEQIREIHEQARQNVSVTDLAEIYGVSEQTIYRHLRDLKSSGEQGV